MARMVWSTAAVLALLIAGPARAQVTVEINPFGGLYLPVADIVELNSVARAAVAQDFAEQIFDLVGVFPSIDLDEFTGKHKSAFTFGGRVTAWVTDAFGVEGSFAYALSDAEVVRVSGVLDGNPFDKADLIDAIEELRQAGEEEAARLLEDFLQLDGNVWLAGLKALYRFAPQASGIWALHIGGGPVLIGRGGDAWEDTEGTTDIGAVLNLGATFDVTPQVAIRLDVEDYLYSAKFKESGTPIGDVDIGDSKFQNDFLFTGGIVIRLGG